MNAPQILLLEDQGMQREAFKVLIVQSIPRSVVHEAACFTQALEILSGEAIDFAFLDFNLNDATGKNGLDVLDFIRERELKTRAVILSGESNGYLDQASVLQCMSAGAFGYIPKAMDQEGLLREAFESVLQGRIFLPWLGSATEPAIPVQLDDLGIKGRLAEVLFYLLQGQSNKVIARRLQLSPYTVSEYVSMLLKRFGVASRNQLPSSVARQGIVIPQPPAPILLPFVDDDI